MFSSDLDLKRGGKSSFSHNRKILNFMIEIDDLLVGGDTIK